MVAPRKWNNHARGLVSAPIGPARTPEIVATAMIMDIVAQDHGADTVPAQAATKGVDDEGYCPA